MDGLLDDQLLDGAHEVRLTYRPPQVALPVKQTDMADCLLQIERACQTWGGATRPLIPVDSEGQVSELWSPILRGSSVDSLEGVHAPDFAGSAPLRVNSGQSGPAYGDQLAVALLRYRRQSEYAQLEVADLQDDDPWRGIYAACLGTLPAVPDRQFLQILRYNPELSFDDFIAVNRINAKGSLDDLLSRLGQQESTNPRRISMVHLSYGSSGSSLIRTRSSAFPSPHFEQHDAGPNVIVLCSPGSVDDIALLWNLRAANGDRFSVPIGVPVAEFDTEAFEAIYAPGNLALNGIAHRDLYITSASIPTSELTRIVSGIAESHLVEVTPPVKIASVGEPGALHRGEVLFWSNGKARFQKVPGDAVSRLLGQGAPSRSARMHVDIEVPSSPLPRADDYRIRPVAGGAFHAGSQSTFLPLDSLSDIGMVEWPSRLVMAQSVAATRGYKLTESDPGRAARIALASIGDIYSLHWLAHAPLLGLLEEMAARQGFNWYKRRLRTAGQSADPLDAVGSTIDELPRKTFNDFKKVLDKNNGATRNWLMWAEKSNLVVKGFEVGCDACGAGQWIPIGAFAPPITCRGCAKSIDYPFGDRASTEFRYRLSERMRRMFERDAMGHLLLVRYFRMMFHSPSNGGYLIGASAGTEIRKRGSVDAIGEADILMLNWIGEFVPGEFKRSASGLTVAEVGKLDLLCDALQAPWSVVSFGQYLKDADPAVLDLERRDGDGVRTRAVLSFDQLLDPTPMLALGGDPFEARALSLSEVQEREASFVQRLVNFGEDSGPSWFEREMLRMHED